MAEAPSMGRKIGHCSSVLASQEPACGDTAIRDGYFGPVRQKIVGTTFLRLGALASRKIHGFFESCQTFSGHVLNEITFQHAGCAMRHCWAASMVPSSGRQRRYQDRVMQQIENFESCTGSILGRILLCFTRSRFKGAGLPIGDSRND